jgi:asparagine N-glycosylation enzyme membrane subunit Stt3
MTRTRTATAIALSTIAFAAAFLIRIANFESAFHGGVPQINPVDDLYHAKRILYSATHFPRILDFDPDRGVNGAFCPWPPLYDFTAALAARLLGGHDANGLLARASWFPPLVFSLFAGGLVAALARRAGLLAGLVAAVSLVLSRPLFGVSRLTSIDHHFLEPPLLLGILAALVSIADLPDDAPPRRTARAGLFLGTALAASLLVQTAFLFAAALTFASVFFLLGERRKALLAGALGLLVAFTAVISYRLTRAPAYPDDEWYLGFPHAIALAAAAVACGLFAKLLDLGWKPASARTAGLLGGIATPFLFPGTLAVFFNGARFFGGDPWLRTIGEFQPLFFGKPAIGADLTLLDGTVLLLPLFVVTAARRLSRARLVLALFALAYFAASISSRRFLVTAIPLLVTAGALVVGDLSRTRPRWAAATALASIAPALVLASAWLRPKEPVIAASAPPMIRTARFLRASGGPGRILCGWSWGHLFDVVGGHPVVLDNFGASLGRAPFNRALAVPLATHEEDVAGYCQETGVRFLVLESPIVFIESISQNLERPLGLYLWKTPGASVPTTLLLETFWWRAYYSGRAQGSAELPPIAPPRLFRLAYRDTSTTPVPEPYGGPVSEVWELLDQDAARGSRPGAFRPSDPTSPAS